MKLCATRPISMLMWFSCASLLPVQSHFRTLKRNGYQKYGLFAQKVLLSVSHCGVVLFICKKSVTLCTFSSLVVVPIVLVGNMKDLRFVEDADFNLPNKLVKMADAYTKGFKINAFGYTEVSAQYNVGVLELLKSAIQAASEKDNKYLSSMV